MVGRLESVGQVCDGGAGGEWMVLGLHFIVDMGYPEKIKVPGTGMVLVWYLYKYGATRSVPHS